MEIITEVFNKVFVPFKGMIVYRSQSNNECFVEAYDMTESGKMINAHPLSHDESESLANSLSQSLEQSVSFLQSDGITPSNLLYLKNGQEGYAIWYTKPQTRNLYFKKELGIADGKYSVPALVWKADKNSLSLYSITDTKKPTIKTALYHAPWFNIYDRGNVCMGNVDIEIEEDCRLENFMRLWEGYFFNSKFSHVLGNRSPVSVNLIQLWQGLHGAVKKFPTETLIKHSVTLKSLLK
jgi:PRTRC genetic system protein B